MTRRGEARITRGSTASTIDAMTSAAIPHVRQSPSTASTRPVFFADLMMSVASNGIQDANVDHVALDPVGAQSRRGLATEVRAVAASDEREILPAAREARAFLREIPFFDRRELFLETIEPSIVEVENRIIGKHTRDEKIARIRRRRRHHDAKTRDVREPRLKRLRVLCALLAPAIDDRANRDRCAHLSAEHRAPLRCLRDELVDREKHEVNSRVNHDRSISAKRSTERSARRAELGHRRVDDTLASELAVEIGHRVSDVPRTPQSLADGEHRRMIREEILEAVSNGGSVSR